MPCPAGIVTVTWRIAWRNIQAQLFVSCSQRIGGRGMAKSEAAIALLKADHRKVEELFKDFEKAKGDGRKERLARQICLELSIHTALEEEIFYPACQGSVEEELLKESYVEHDAAKLLIAEIEAGAGEGDEFF